MRKIVLITLLSLFGASYGFSAQPLLDRAAHDLKKRLPMEDPDSPFKVQDEELYSLKHVMEFYDRRDFQLAWSDKNGVTVAAIELLNTLQKADREGLNPKDYHLEKLSILGAAITQDAHENQRPSATKFENLDLLLTDAFLTYADHLLSGRINPNEIDDEWHGTRRSGDMVDHLEQAFQNDDVRGMLKSLHPTQYYYSRLKIAYGKYKNIERNGGWEIIPDGKPLKNGDSDPRVPLLQARLAVEGDLRRLPNDKEEFDDAIQRAVLNFQKRHGIEPDGKLGKETLIALNVPASQRVHQLEVNLERCRWLPGNLGDPHVLVNAANYSLDVVEKGDPTLSMKVVVGRRYRHTPVFSSTITTVVFNPYWTVPVKLARLDILEHIKEEPDYLSKHKFKVYKGYDDGALEVDPSTVDWSTVDPKTMDYKFRQNPGTTNALGQIKFLLPNEFDVYLHDTPSRELFNRTKRDFSSGCIRIEKPIELAAFLLHINYGWTLERVMESLKNKSEQFVTLDHPIPVHLMYWTAWMDERGVVQFREDIYNRDATLDAALHKAPEKI